MRELLRRQTLQGSLLAGICPSDSTKAQNNRVTHLTPPEVGGMEGKERKQRLPKEPAAGVKSKEELNLVQMETGLQVGAGREA